MVREVRERAWCGEGSKSEGTTRGGLQQLPQRGGDINFASGYSDEEIFSVDNVEPYVPASYEEAVAPDNPWREKWIEAMASDVAGKQSIGEDGTWTLVDMEVPKAKGRNIMKGKWTYTIKMEQGAHGRRRVQGTLGGKGIHSDSRRGLSGDILGDASRHYPTLLYL